MPGNRKQRERVALALSAQAEWDIGHPETSQLITAILSCADWGEVLEELAGAMPGGYAEEALPAVCKAAGIRGPHEHDLDETHGPRPRRIR
jgi:hypothetical protein